LSHVSRGADAADADHRHAAGALEHPTYRQDADREQRRAAHAAIAVAEPRHAGGGEEKAG